MSWSVILILLLVFAMMLGPIMMLKPSRRQQQIAQLRQTAARLGLRVELQTLGGRQLAVYSVAWPREAGQKFPGVGWALDKAGYEHGIHFDGRWQWRDKRAAPEPLQAGLHEALRHLPAGVEAVEATPLGLGCLWTESGGSRELDLMAAWLQHQARILWGLMHPQPA